MKAAAVFVAYVQMPKSYGSTHRVEFDSLGDADAYAGVMRHEFKALVTVVTEARS